MSEKENVDEIEYVTPEFNNISKDDKIKHFNPLYLSSPFLKFGSFLFFIFLFIFVISIWFIDIDFVYIILFLISFQLFYLYFLFLFIKISLKYSFPGLSNRLFISKFDLLPILSYQTNTAIILDSEKDETE